MRKIYTILINFRDHTVGIGQYDAESAEDSLRQFIQSCECLEDYDRDLLIRFLMPLVHIAHKKGIWSFYFNPDLMGIKWPDDNPVLGGHIIQADPIGSTRK